MAHTYGTVVGISAGTTNPFNIILSSMDALDTVLVLFIKTVGATDRTGGSPRYDGNVLTQANTTQKAAASPECGAELWYFLNPKVLNGTISIPNNGSLTLRCIIASARAKAGATSRFDVANGANATAANPSPGSITTTKDGAAIFSCVATGAQTWAPSAQAGTAINNTDDGADGRGFQYNMQSTAGAIDLNWTFGTSDDYGAVVAAFVENEPVNFNNYNINVRASGLSVAERAFYGRR